jgi:hypothetical protein
VPFQFVVRVTCPSCGDPDAQLRVAFPHVDMHRQPDPSVALFYCVNATREDHDTPHDDDLLAAVPSMDDVIERAPWWDRELAHR